MRAADSRYARTASRHAVPGRAKRTPEDPEVEVEVPLSTFWRSPSGRVLGPERWRWAWARLLRHGRAREARAGEIGLGWGWGVTSGRRRPQGIMPEHNKPDPPF